MSKEHNLLNILLGFIAGIISGFFGAGGGLILIPYFSKILKEDEVTSRATTILCIFVMVIVSCFFYSKNSAINLDIGIKCIIGGIVGSILGSKLLRKIKSKYLELFFIIFLFYSSFSIILK